ncbi:MAG TPA: hypothetical protein VIP70_11000 [Nitrososphaeraceae archaeon]
MNTRGVTFYLALSEYQDMKNVAEYLYWGEAIPRPTVGTCAMAACLKMYNDLSSILASEQYALTSKIVGDLNKGMVKVTFYLSSSKFEAIRKMVQYLYARNVIRRPTIGTYARIACLKMRNELLQLFAKEQQEADLRKGSKV